MKACSLPSAIVHSVSAITARTRVVKFFGTSCANNPVCIWIVGINYADYCIGYESERQYQTDGSSGRRHPFQEAATAEQRLYHALNTRFDELLFLRYKATNASPFEFEWVDHISTNLDYAAALARISEKYDNWFC